MESCACWWILISTLFKFMHVEVKKGGQMMWLGEHKCGKGMSSTAVAAHCGRSLYGEESDDL